MRVDLYKGLEDAFLENISLTEIGKRFILPSSYIGSPRHMHELYQDAIAIVMKFGKPDLLG